MSDIKHAFGAKALIFYNRATLKPVGIFRVISSVEFAREIEKLPLSGGHHNGPYAVEAGEPSNSLTATLKEFPDFAFTELDNASKSEVTDEATSGDIGTIANKSGTSVVSATTGIASVGITSGKAGILPLGRIVVVAASATTVDVYLLGDVASGSIPVTNELTLLQAGVTIPGSDGTVDLTAYGITITGGSGTVAMTEGDTAVFSCRPANSKTTIITMSDAADVKYLGCILVYPKTSDKRQRIVDFPKVAVVGTPFAANTREYAEFELSAMPLVDPDVSDKLFEITDIVASN